MSTKANFLKGPAVWTLVAGIAIGAGSMYSIFTGHGGSLAIAQTRMNPRPVAITKSSSLAALKALDEGFSTLADYASPAVVLIKSESKSTPGLTGMSNMPRGGEGSGVIFRPDGYIITNDHVVGGFDKVTVVLHDGREFPGKVTRAEESDIAVVKIEADHLPTLPFADSTKVKVGQLAMAIGAPYGWEDSVTIGHVSGLNRFNSIADQMTGKERIYPELIQTDAAINMGNSGGPLIDVDGEVIGINSSIVSPTGGGIGIGFSITSNQARMLAETLIEKGKITRAFIGIGPADLKEFQKNDWHLTGGALVMETRSDGPAAAAGIKTNDVIVRIGSMPINAQIDLRNSMLKYAPGSTVDVEYIRDGQHKTAKVKLVEAPAQVARTIPQNGVQNFDFGGPGPDGMPDIKDFMKQFRDRSIIPTPDQGSQDQGNRQFGHAVLGVQVHDIDDNARKQFHIPSGAKGAAVVAVTPGSIADKMGMKPGDVIQAIGNKQVASADEVKNTMEGVHWGDTKRVKYARYGDSTYFNQERDVTFK